MQKSVSFVNSCPSIVRSLDPWVAGSAHLDTNGSRVYPCVSAQTVMTSALGEIEPMGDNTDAIGFDELLNWSVCKPI